MANKADLERLLQPPKQWPNYNGYRPLDQSRKDIRLLRISYRPGTTEIQAKVEHASLEARPEYEALSYCWGPPDKQRTIYVENQDVLIRASLWSFLDRLCQKEQPSVIWLDSICINQKDIIERNWQVSMMHEIYSNARCVRAWIGEADADTEYALAFAENRLNPLLLGSEYFSQIKQQALVSLNNVVHRPYWRRLWIVQEVALAKALSIHCGPRVVEWSKLVDAVEDLDTFQHVERDFGDDNPFPILDHTEPVDCLRGLNNLRKGLNDTNFVRPDHKSHSLGRLLTEFGRYSCDDVRDKFYGLRGIAADGHLLRIDYGKPVGDVFFDALSMSATAANTHNRINSNIENLSWSALLNEARDYSWKLNLSFEDLLSFRSGTESKDLCSSLFEVKYPLRTWWKNLTSAGDPGDVTWNGDRLGSGWFPYTYDDRPAPGDLLYSLGFSQNTKTFDPQVVLRREEGSSLRIVGVITSNGKRHPESVLQAVALREMQLCKSLQVSPDGQRCRIFFHHSRIAVLAMMWEGPKSIRRQVEEYRVGREIPSLCTCDVSSEEMTRGLELLNRKSEQERLMFRDGDLRTIQHYLESDKRWKPNSPLRARL